MFGTFLRPRLSKRRRTRFRLTACHRVITGPMQRVDQQIDAQKLCDFGRDAPDPKPSIDRNGNEI